MGQRQGSQPKDRMSRGTARYHQSGDKEVALMTYSLGTSLFRIRRGFYAASASLLTALALAAGVLGQAGLGLSNRPDTSAGTSPGLASLATDHPHKRVEVIAQFQPGTKPAV